LNLHHFPLAESFCSHNLNLLNEIFFCEAAAGILGSKVLQRAFFDESDFRQARKPSHQFQKVASLVSMTRLGITFGSTLLNGVSKVTNAATI
jgi:hypothetical protein